MADIKRKPSKNTAAKQPQKKRPEANSVKKGQKSKKNSQKTQKSKKSSLINTKYLGGLLFSKMARAGAKLLSKNADEVNKLNVFPVPDGDTGDNMRMTVESGLAAIENMDSDDLAEVMRALSHGMLLGARGNSGVILSQFFAGIAKGLDKYEKADAFTFGNALKLGVQQAYSSVMTPTEGTILTVAREAVDYAVARTTPESTVRSLFADLAKEMRSSLERTPEFLAVLKEAGVVDSGGAGLLYIIDGFNRALNGEDVSGGDEDRPKSASNQINKPDTGFGPDSVMSYGYCTELLLQLMTAKTDPELFDIEPLKAYLSEIGDSIVAFKAGSIVKVHVHTLTPEKVLAYCRCFGEFISVKIENMCVQHSELDGGVQTKEKEEKLPEQPKKKYGVVTVSNGNGITALFKEFGADVVVDGGQTQNPSTNDFLAAFEEISAEIILVLPNNSNIYMAAKQAADMYQKAEVRVIPTKNVGTGYVALSSMDLESDDVDSMLKTVGEAIARVNTGYVSPSIRDADMNGVNIKNGDTIGIIGKEIIVSCGQRMEAVKVLVKTLLDGEKFMLTVFKGDDGEDDDCEALKAYMQEEHPDVECYFIDGGQKVYPFIFVAE